MTSTASYSGFLNFCPGENNPMWRRWYIRISQHPAGVWTLVLAVIFTAEFALMLVLPWVLGEQPSRFLESTVDAVVLTLLVSPVLWWMLVKPLRHALALRARVLSDIISNIEAERARIAHDLHDGVGQSLTLLVSGLRSMSDQPRLEEIVRRGNELQQLAQGALIEVKEMSFALRPSLLDDLGLVPALERVARDVKRHFSLELILDIHSLEGKRLAEAVETAVFRIFQESVNNIVKHAHARQAHVQLREVDGFVILQIEDDGCGIPADQLAETTDTTDGLGLVGMRERAALLGGKLTVASTVGAGTRITARLPVKSP